ncbi:MAG: phosphopentomutase, partial [Armatimonadota bacterium]
MIDRIIIIVLDSLGVGALPDAAEYGDENTNTLSHIAKLSGGLYIPNLQNMGIGNITNIKGVEQNGNALGCYGKMSEKSKGKDTITGHWELMGII